MQLTLEDMVVEGNKMAVRFTVRGTDLPTGKPVSLTGLSVMHYSAGKIAEEWEVAR